MKASVPIGFAALCGVMCERSGVVNIGIEGTMLVAAFVGWTAGVYLEPVLGSTVWPIFGITPTLLAALALAILAGVLVSLVHAWLSISVKADQIISGTIINIAAFGITGYLISLLSLSSPEGAGQFKAFHPPEFLLDLPIVGWLFDTILGQGPITIGLHRHRHRLPDRAVPDPLGPAQPGGRRAPARGRDGRHRRHPAALPERHAGRRPGRARRRLPEHGGDRRLPAGHDRRARDSSAWPR